jgi:two-component system NtrC family sensor kinase
MMPDMTGMDFYDALRERRPGDLDRVMFLTGGAVTDRARAFLDRMAGRAVDKPVDSLTLRNLVRRHVQAAAQRGDTP